MAVPSLAIFAKIGKSVGISFCDVSLCKIQLARPGGATGRSIK